MCCVSVKNEISYRIPQDEIKDFLNLDNQKFQELKKQVGINTAKPLNLNNFKTLISFASCIGIVSKELHFDLEPFKVNENNLVDSMILDTPEAKKIKIYKEKRTKQIKQKIKKTAIKEKNE